MIFVLFLLAGLIIVVGLAATLSCAILNKERRKQLHKERKFWVCVLLTTVMTFGVLPVIVVRSLKHEIDFDSARVEANRLISRAGGVDVVCAEADRIFEQYNVSDPEQYFPKGPDLRDFPAIASIGLNHCIFSDGHPYLSLHVHMRRGVFFLKIVSTNGLPDFLKGSHCLEIVPSRIYINK